MRLVAAILLFLAVSPAHARDIWSPQQANTWYARQAWLVGANYVPASAVNQLEMWQAATFDPTRIDRELEWAQAIGMNTVRVFLHDLLWTQDAEGFKRRIDRFLQIADHHGIRPIFVLFDSCWEPIPALGPQHPPIPGVHNSGWVQSPGIVSLRDPSDYRRLQAYVTGVIAAFANDQRVLLWDVWNEPDNVAGRFPGQEGKELLVRALLPQVFIWARSVQPVQPLTAGVWAGKDWSPGAQLSPMQQIQLSQSDVISFHDYHWPEEFEVHVKQLRPYGRPIICTEYLARGYGSTFEGSLPIGKQYNVGMINWGLVDGKTQTRLPWDSWQRPYVLLEPPIWHHDVLRADGTPYRQAEIDLIRKETERSK